MYITAFHFALIPLDLQKLDEYELLQDNIARMIISIIHCWDSTDSRITHFKLHKLTVSLINGGNDDVQRCSGTVSCLENMLRTEQLISSYYWINFCMWKHTLRSGIPFDWICGLTTKTTTLPNYFFFYGRTYAIRKTSLTSYGNECFS